MNRRFILAGMALTGLAPLGPDLAAAQAQAPIARGEFIRLDAFPSQSVAARRVDIWLPPDYAKGKKRSRVLYMHDGQNLFDPANSTWNKIWAVDQHVLQLRADRKIEDVILVGIWNTPLRTREYAPADLVALLPDALQDKMRAYAGGPILSDGYADFLALELKPYIEANYRTRRGSEHHVLMGSSMGGLISLYALMRHPRAFGAAACLSTHWPLSVPARGGWDEADWRAAIIAAERAFVLNSALDPERHRLYFDYGTQTLDGAYEPYQQQVDQALAAKGFRFGRNWVTQRFPGAAHEENSWNARLDTPLLFLLGA